MGQQQIMYDNLDNTHACVFSPDGKLILSANGNATLKVWDPFTGKEHRSLKGHRDRINGCTFSPDGNYALSCSEDGTARLWDIESEKELTQWLTDTDLYSCAFHPHGDLVLVSDDSGGVHFLKLEWPSRHD
jgi:WD40 repeat protein